MAFTTMATVINKINANKLAVSCDRAPPRYGKSIPYHLISRKLSNRTVHVPATKNDDILSISKENRSDCPLCKKYSQGPCGTLFQQWLECIDANEGEEHKCDPLVVPLDKCLKDNKELYDKISLYDDDNDEDAVEKWREFIQQVEGEDGIKYKPFEEKLQPEMQLRPKSQMGAAMFHPKVDDQVLLLAYVKEQDGNLLGAGSVEDLFEFQDQYVLRFSVTGECRDISAHGLYGYEDDRDDVVIYRKTERIPPS